jgi:hypothetical protein
VRRCSIDLDAERRLRLRPKRSLLGGPALISCRDEKSKHTYRMVLSLNMKKDRHKKRNEPELI